MPLLRLPVLVEALAPVALADLDLRQDRHLDLEDRRLLRMDLDRKAATVGRSPAPLDSLVVALVASNRARSTRPWEVPVALDHHRRRRACLASEQQLEVDRLEVDSEEAILRLLVVEEALAASREVDLEQHLEILVRLDSKACLLPPEVRNTLSQRQRPLQQVDLHSIWVPTSRSLVTERLPR